MATASSGHSLGATTATNTTVGTVDSSIAIAYSNQKTHHKLDAWYFGPGRRPFKYGIATAVCALLVLVAGLTVLGLRFAGRVLVGSWEGEFIAPCIIICGVLLFALSIKFFLLARKKSDEERKKISFKAEGLTHVSTINVAFEPDRSSKNKYRYDVKSGTSSEKSVRSPDQSMYSGTLDSRYSRGSWDNRLRPKKPAYTGSLPSLDGRTRAAMTSGSSLPSLDRHPQSTPKKASNLTRTPDSMQAPPKPMRSLDGSTSGLSDGKPVRAVTIAMDDDDDEVFPPRVRSESEYSDIPL